MSLSPNAIMQLLFVIVRSHNNSVKARTISTQKTAYSTPLVQTDQPIATRAHSQPIMLRNASNHSILTDRLQLSPLLLPISLSKSRKKILPTAAAVPDRGALPVWQKLYQTQVATRWPHSP